MGSDGCASLATTSRLLCLLSQQSVFVLFFVYPEGDKRQSNGEKESRTVE